MGINFDMTKHADGGREKKNARNLQNGIKVAWTWIGGLQKASDG